MIFFVYIHQEKRDRILTVIKHHFHSICMKLFTDLDYRLKTYHMMQISQIIRCCKWYENITNCVRILNIFIRTSCLFVFAGDFIFPTHYVFVCECCFSQLHEQSERVNMFSYTGIFFSHSNEFETCIVLLCHAVYTDTIKNQNRETLCAIVLRWHSSVSIEWRAVCFQMIDRKFSSPGHG